MVGCKKAMATLGERAQERLWGGANSTSWGERSASCSLELADLVDSFYGGGETGVDDWVPSSGTKVVASEREVLRRLVDVGGDGGLGSIGMRVRDEVESVVASGAGGTEGEKELEGIVMASLRDRGFDAGLCMPWPEGKTAQFPSAVLHEYVDVIVDDETRYVVDLNFAAEFEIARPTPEYAALLANVPVVFVGQPETMKEIVCTMCEAARESMQRRGMHLPPWRRREYMLAKWFGPCKRTTNCVKKNADIGGAGGSELGRRKAVTASTATMTITSSGGGGSGGGGCRVEYERGGEWEKRRLGVAVMGNYL